MIDLFDNMAKVKAWTELVPVERDAAQQISNLTTLPFVTPHIAVMPDVHLGRGATVGTVIPTKGAIIPAAVGVDIGCGMDARRLENLKASDLPDNLHSLRMDIEMMIPVGMAAFNIDNLPKIGENVWYGKFKQAYEEIEAKHPLIGSKHSAAFQLGTLGGGNHFVEVCLDETDTVWLMLHSGSRNVGNRIGTYFINRAKEEMIARGIKLPDNDLAYLVENTENFRDYIKAMRWAQDYAEWNRRVMMDSLMKVIRKHFPDKDVGMTRMAVSCHHNYAMQEMHFGENLWITRKGAVSAREGQLGIIPGSMGTRSYIVSGKGNADSFNSCSHGAGRAMSRAAAKKRFSLEDHIEATFGVECRKDAGVIDETPMAYKDIDAVMDSQYDLVNVVHTLKAVLCVKG